MTSEFPELNEVVVTSETNSTVWSVAAWNPWNGSSLVTYKGPPTGQNRLLVVNGSIIAAASLDKPLLDVWYFQHRSLEKRTIVTPGIVKALHVSQDGVFLAAAIDEQVAVWDVSSGELLALLRRHYLSVNCLSFTDDCSNLVTGGEDGLVLVWDMAASLFTSRSASAMTTVTHNGASHDESAKRQVLLHTWSGHALGITDLHVGRGCGSMTRVASASADQTVRLWDNGTGDCLATFVFDHIVSSIIMDACEYHLYAGCWNGDIVQVSLSDSPNIAGSTMDLKQINSRVRKLLSHKQNVTALSISFDGTSLVSGSDDSNVCIWDLASRQVMRTIVHKSPVTNAFFCFAPYLNCAETLTVKEPLWPQLQKRLNEQQDSYSENNEIFHNIVIK